MTNRHIIFKTFIDFLLNPLAPPTSLPLQGQGGVASQRKKLSAPRISLSLDQSEDDLFDTPDDLDINVDDLDTPDEADYTDHEIDWEGRTLKLVNNCLILKRDYQYLDKQYFSEPLASQRDSVKEAVEPIPTYSAQEERQDSKLWRTVIIGEQEHRINMKSIEPYQKVISHGGTLK